MDEQNSTTPTLTPAQVRANTLRERREAKAAAKDALKALNAVKRANGVIGTLHQMLQRPNGTTKKEVLAALTVKFPDRDPIGMATTVGIQLSRLQKKHGKIVSRKQGDRGLVYGYERTVQYQPEGSSGVDVPDAEPQTKEIETTPEPAHEIVEPTPTAVKQIIDAARKGGKKGSKKAAK